MWKARRDLLDGDPAQLLQVLLAKRTGERGSKTHSKLPWILSSANLVQSRKNARFHPNLMAHSLKNQAYFSPSHTLIRKISRRGAEFSHPIDAKPCWSPCPWTRSPSHAWPAKIRFALSLGYNVCMSWQKNPGTCSTKPFLRATQR